MRGGNDEIGWRRENVDDRIREIHVRRNNPFLVGTRKSAQETAVKRDYLLILTRLVVNIPRTPAPTHTPQIQYCIYCTYFNLELTFFSHLLIFFFFFEAV